jgi:antitoxin HicB
MKTLEYYLKLPYTMVVRQDDEGDFVARIDELPGCIAHASTAKEAIENLDDVKKVWLEEGIEAGRAIPEPQHSEGRLLSGKWVQRVPRTLHRKLVDQAAREGVSLNQFVVSALAEAVGHRQTQMTQTIQVMHVEPSGKDAWRDAWAVLAKTELGEAQLWDINQPRWSTVGPLHRDLADILKGLKMTFEKKRTKSGMLENVKEEKEHQHFAFNR